MGELRKLPKRVVKLAGAELPRYGGNMRRLFEQGGGVGADVDAKGGSLATKILSVNNNGLGPTDHSRSQSQQRNVAFLGLFKTH